MTRAPRRRPLSEREKPVSDMSSADRPAATEEEEALDDGELDPQAQRALEFVQMLLEKMTMDAEVSIAPDDGEGGENEIRLEIEGPDAGRIIGKRGQVLEA